MIKKCIVLNEDKFPISQWRTGIEYGVLCGDKKNELTMPSDTSSCRGYLGDTISAHKNPKQDSISNYRFKTFNHLAGDSFLYVRRADEKIIEKNIDFLHKLEKQAKVKKSIVYKTKAGHFVFHGSGYWKDSVWKYMLWTFLVKCVCHTIPRITDQLYWNRLNKVKGGVTNLDILLSHVKKSPDHEEFNLPDYGTWEHYAFHSNSGFIAAISNINKTMHKKLGLIA